MRYKILVLSLSLALLGPIAIAHTQPVASTTLKVSADHGRLSELKFAGRSVALFPDGGFQIFDTTAKNNLPLSQGKIATSDSITSFQSQSPELRLAAKFVPHDEYVEISGEIENLRHDDRGFIVEYRVPLQLSSAILSTDIVQKLPVTETEFESNAFPLAAMSGDGQGVAIAIPPTTPRDFGVVGSRRGLSIRFYVGTTQKTRLFPSKAPFTFILYAVDPVWGFRSALSRYYGFFPDYYKPRMMKDGLYMVAQGPNTPVNADEYGFELFETQLPTYAESLARNKKYHIATFPYMIVGQREIKFLPELPQNYAQAMDMYHNWTIKSLQGHEVRKEFACTEGDKYIHEEIDSSGVKHKDGTYSTAIRSTEWGDKSVTFRTNPNPYLFEGQHRHTVGADALLVQTDWIDHHPEYNGMFVDSLGSNWPSVLNYRQDHFADARYPLTTDTEGNIALDNAISHYEYVEALRARTRANGLLLNGNGIYAFTPRRIALGGPARQIFDFSQHEFVDAAGIVENYRSQAKLSRFFIAALLDVASNERGIKSTVEQDMDVRTLMGKKQFALINYDWKDASQIEDFLNESLCFAIFASTTKGGYDHSPNGYFRDKAILDWYMPLERKLSRAGWEPVRYAEVFGNDISSERYGTGDTVYLTLYNGATTERSSTVNIDFKSLGMEEAVAVVTEIARQQPLTRTAAGFTLTMKPHRTYVLQIARKPSSIAAID